jgi:hypothetical protein
MENNKDFKGCIEPTIKWEAGAELILQPVYLVPVEVFRTGLLSRPTYGTVTVVVDAVGGRTQILHGEEVLRVTGSEPEGVRLPVNISRERAVGTAKSAVISEGREGWRSLAGSSHAIAREEKVHACWIVWIRSGGSLTDSTSGKSVNAGEILGLVLPWGESP